ncbi:NADP-dependent oxidoreductase [Hydrocarboniphaga sp.]|uniref:NADP-dependent oxidoreductase n=1 Tax=Hydrocarboniphaga sp. TaxID=2033016 RepID=UPI003D0E1696
MSALNRCIVLASRPVGIPQPQHFELTSAALAPLQAGELLIENLYLSVDPAQRGYVNDEDNYSPPVAIGAVMRSLAVGRVVESRHQAYAVGDYLYGWFGWQQLCICTADAILRRVNPQQASLSAAAGLLGINGLTAWMALHDIGKPQTGETVVVSAAAGAVGALAGQLAHLAGCRVVAIVGDDDKGRRCIADYGYDAYVNYRQPLADVLRAVCPDGVDVYFDNVGGNIADSVIRRMNRSGRVIQCGTISIPSWVPVPQGPRVEREILTRRLRMEGFVIFDHVKRYDAVAAELAALAASGKLRCDEDIEQGLEMAPQALVDVYAGRNTGKKLIQLAAA